MSTGKELNRRVGQIDIVSQPIFDVAKGGQEHPDARLFVLFAVIMPKMAQ